MVKSLFNVLVSIYIAMLTFNHVVKQLHACTVVLESDFLRIPLFRRVAKVAGGTCGWPHLVQSGLRVVITGLGYILMLIAMTYNVWLFFSLIIGGGVGYFLFARVVYLLPGMTNTNYRDQLDPCH